MKSGCLKALIVDDDMESTQILREAASRAPGGIELDSVNDGPAALSYLRDPKCQTDFVLLDLDLPSKSGFDVLKEIGSDQRLRTLPVLILSSAADVVSIRKAYECGANLFFSKPLELDRYRELMELISNLWGGFAELPCAKGV